ncbi:MAG: MoaD/ThiS family protein [Coriobacteriia bacterium]|nr:MoaD/ThiS family protein [Coriobacteriia bacterium]
MNVDVALFASLSAYQPDGQAGRHARTFDLAAGTTIATLIAELKLPDQARVVFIDGRHAEESAALHDGQRLAIFPPVAGG